MTNKIFIIEDDKNIREELFFLLAKRSEISVVGYCSTVKEALKVLPNTDIDLALMDIQLQDGKSFEIIEQLPKIDFNIIFITAYNNFAIRAIKAGAIDYLLKPIDADELYDSLDKFEKRQQKEFDIKQKELLLRYTKSTEPLKNIVVRTIDKIYFLKISDIIYCNGQGNYTTLFLKDRANLVSSKPLKDYENLLPDDIFLKTHQSYIVNRNYVDYYSNNGELILNNGEGIPVSIRRRDMVISLLIK